MKMYVACTHFSSDISPLKHSIVWTDVMLKWSYWTFKQDASACDLSLKVYCICIDLYWLWNKPYNFKTCAPICMHVKMFSILLIRLMYYNRIFFHFISWLKQFKINKLLLVWYYSHTTFCRRDYIIDVS
jgi:hypothetical protein